MNKYIKKELEKVTNINLPPYDDSTTKLLIKRKKNISPVEKHYYIISLSKTLLNSENDINLVSNWNHGIVPRSIYMKCEVLKLSEKMIKINSSGYDIEKDVDLSDIYYNLWLPLEKIEFLEEI